MATTRVLEIQTKPKDKPQVERAIPYVRESYWKGRDFASLGEMIDGAAR